MDAGAECKCDGIGKRQGTRMLLRFVVTKDPGQSTSIPTDIGLRRQYWKRKINFRGILG
jgi:hypothetical protein